MKQSQAGLKRVSEPPRVTRAGLPPPRQHRLPKQHERAAQRVDQAAEGMVDPRADEYSQQAQQNESRYENEDEGRPDFHAIHVSHPGNSLNGNFR